MMFARQNSVRIYLDFPPRERSDPILLGHGMIHQVVKTSEIEVELAVMGESTLERR